MNYNPTVTPEFRRYQKAILKDFGSWRMMTPEEKTEFDAITEEVKLERFVRSMFDKYIMKW